MFSLKELSKSPKYEENMKRAEELIDFKIIYRNIYINFHELDRYKISTIKELKKHLVYYFKIKLNTAILEENICLSKKFIELQDEENIKILENKIILLSIIPIICDNH